MKVRGDGVVKVLDFGLAKPPEPAEPDAAALSQSPTAPAGPVTGVGTIVGTAAYMAPEQARGAKVDKRADIWALGAVLYEMLSGRQAFGGPSVSDTLASVLRSEPPWEALPDAVPGALRELVQRCW